MMPSYAVGGDLLDKFLLTNFKKKMVPLLERSCHVTSLRQRVIRKLAPLKLIKHISASSQNIFYEIRILDLRS